MVKVSKLIKLIKLFAPRLLSRSLKQKWISAVINRSILRISFLFATEIVQSFKTTAAFQNETDSK